MSATNDPGRDPGADREPLAPEHSSSDDRYDRGSDATAAVPAEAQSSQREDVAEREREQFGGMKFGSAFFGWLTATGLAAILGSLIAAIGIGVLGGVEEATDQAMANALGGVIVGSIVAIVVLFVAYYCGGYVAGRMARFSGAKQGIAVWLWGLIIAIVLAIVGAIVGSQFNVLARVNAFPAIPMNPQEFSAAGIITAVLALAASLGGAVLGGIAGMRFHRRVDRAGLGR